MEGRRISSAVAEASRLRSMKYKRKSSVNQAVLERALEAKIALVEGHNLSEEDRKLAEMGYEQVRKTSSSIHIVR
jgi:hypothetical protein